MAVTRETILNEIEALPREAWDELWLLVEYLKFKTLLAAPPSTGPKPDPEGAFPELDLSYEVIEASLQSTWQARRERLSAGVA